MPANAAMESFGRQPMYAGDEPAYLMDFNVGMDPMLGMAGNMASSWLANRGGMVPGQFFPGQNVFDQIRTKGYYADQASAMGIAAQSDRASYVDLMRGMARMTGRNFGLRQERAAQSLAGFMSGLNPTLIQMLGPDLVDDLHGSRGSAAVMARFLHRGGRYGMDPISGNTGMSGASAGAIARTIGERFAGPGGVSAFSGMGQGRLGMLFNELQLRGVMGPSISAYDTPRQLTMMGADSGFAASEFARIREANPQLHQALVADLDARNPAVAASARSQAAGIRAATDLAGLDRAEFDRLSDGFTSARGFATLSAGRQVDELVTAGVSPISAMSSASRDELARALTGAQLGRAAAFAGIRPGDAATMQGMDLAGRRNLLAALPASRQRQLVDELQDTQRRSLGIGAAPAEQVLASLAPDKLADLVRDYRQQTGINLGGMTADQQRAALAQDKNVASQALQDLQARDPARFALIGAGRSSRVRSMSELSDAEKADELAADPTRMSAVLDSIRTRRPDLYAQYQREGIVDQINAPRTAGAAGASPAEQDRQLAATQRDARAALERIGRDAPNLFEDVQRNFDAKKIVTRLQSLSGSVAAMRDIFGDAGRPNAPMKEIVEGLNQLTQGGMATMSPEALEKSVRVTQSIARTTGLGLDAMMGLMARGSSVADSLGIERIFVPQAAQGAAAFGQAFGQVGRGDIAHLQARSKEEMTLIDEQLRLQGINSGMANQMATTVRAVDETLAAGGTIGAPARALADAIRGGRSTFRNPLTGRDESVFMEEAEFDKDGNLTGGWRKLMEDSGVAQSTLMDFARQTTTNRETVFRNQAMMDLVRQAQSGEMGDFVAEAQRSSIVDVLGRAGFTGDGAESAAAKASRAAADTLLRMDPGARRSDEERNRLTAEAMRDALMPELKAAGIDPASVAQSDLVRAAGLGFGNFNEMASRQRLPGGTALSALESVDQTIEARRRAISQENAAQAQMRSALAGVGRAGPLARIVDAIVEPQEGTAAFVSKVLGGINPDEVQSAMARLSGMSDAQLQSAGITSRDQLNVQVARLTKLTQLDDLMKRRAPSEDPQERARQAAARLGIAEEAEALVRGGASAQSQLTRMLRDKGLTESDIPGAIGGAVGGLTEDERNRLAALRLSVEQGIASRADEAGLVAGAKVGRDQSEEVARAGMSSYDAIAALQGMRRDADPAAYDDAKAEAVRRAGFFADTADARLNDLIGDVRSVEALGAGGLELAKGVRGSFLDLQDLANRKAGGDVANLLASGDKDALMLQKSITEGFDAIFGRQSASPEDLDPMGAAERKAASAYRDALAMDENEQNRNLVARLVRETGGGKDPLTDDQQQSLSALLGTGKAGEVARHHLDRQLSARSTLVGMAEDRGEDPDSFLSRVAGLKPGDRPALFGREEHDKLMMLKAQAGSTLRLGDKGEGLSYEAYTSALGEAKPRDPQASAGDGQQGSMKMSGTLRIVGLQEAILSGRADNEGANHTPVMSNSLGS